MSPAKGADPEAQTSARSGSEAASPGGRQGWWWLLGSTVAALAWALLRPEDGPEGLNLQPFREILRALRPLREVEDPLRHPLFHYLLRNVGGNILVFMPLGFAVVGLRRYRGALRAWGAAVVVGFLFSLTIEVAQLVVPRRVTDVDDLFFNTIGAALGGALCLLLVRQRR